MDSFDEYQADEEYLVIGIFDNLENKHIQLFFSIAKLFRGLQFALCCTEFLKSEFNLIENENIMFSSLYGREKTLFRGRFAQQEIFDFISFHKWIVLSTLTSLEQLKQLQNENEVVVLALFDKYENKNVQVFYSIQQTLNPLKDSSKESEAGNSQYSNQTFQQQIKYAITFDSSIFEQLGIDSESKQHVVSFNRFDEGRSDFNDLFEKEKLNQFIQTNKFPLISEYSDEAADRIFEYDIEVLILLFVSKSSEKFPDTYDSFKEAALKYRGKVLFVLNDIDLAENQLRMQRYGIEYSDVPALRLMSQEGIKYKPKISLISANAVCTFIADFFGKKLKPFRFSQPVPEDWDAGPVKQLVGSNFDQIARDPDKNVFVLFYHPLVCECEQLMDVYNELGENFSESQEMVIAKMDYTTNQLDDIQIKSCHEIKLFLKVTNKLIDYEEDETDLIVENFIEFLSENS